MEFAIFETRLIAKKPGGVPGLSDSWQYQSLLGSLKERIFPLVAIAATADRLVQLLE